MFRLHPRHGDFVVNQLKNLQLLEPLKSYVFWSKPEKSTFRDIALTQKIGVY